jgi:hypothetical protein
MTPEQAVAISDYINLYFLDPLFCILVPVGIVFMIYSIWRDWQADKKEEQERKQKSCS